MLQKRELTLKQRRFADAYLASGNGTQAALQSYQVKNANTAHVIAYENLQKPMVQRYIQKKLQKEELSVGLVLQKLIEEIDAENPLIRLKVLELLGKHLKMFTDKTDHTRVLEGVKSIGWASPCEKASCLCKCHGNLDKFNQ